MPWTARGHAGDSLTGSVWNRCASRYHQARKNKTGPHKNRKKQRCPFDGRYAGDNSKSKPSPSLLPWKWPPAKLLKRYANAHPATLFFWGGTNEIKRYQKVAFQGFVFPIFIIFEVFSDVKLSPLSPWSSRSSCFQRLGMIWDMATSLHTTHSVPVRLGATEIFIGHDPSGWSVLINMINNRNGYNRKFIH